MKKKDIKGLLLCNLDWRRSTLSYDSDWVDAFQQYSGMDLDTYNFDSPRAWLNFIPRIRKYDIIIFMHGTNLKLTEVVSNNHVMRYALYAAMKYRKGKVIFFVDNEYMEIPEKLRFIRGLQVDYIATMLPLEVAGWLYSDCNVQIIPTPHALNEGVFKPEKKLHERPIDLGGRSCPYPWFLGDQDRNTIFRFFSALNVNDFVVDIHLGNTNRFKRVGWTNFLNSCKGVIGTEAGTSYLEKDDHTIHAVEWYLAENPSASFEEVYEKFFAGYKNSVSGKAISSRHFDAIGTKTCQIMFPGRFNDILVADEHYIALNRDFSNIDDVLKRFKDASYCQNMVDQTYEYVMDCHTYKHRIKTLMERIL